MKKFQKTIEHFSMNNRYIRESWSQKRQTSRERIS